MKRQLTLLTSVLATIAGLNIAGLNNGSTIAAQPQPVQTAKSSICQQYGPDYKELYSFEADNQSITICQKGNQYYYIQTAKPELSLATPNRPANPVTRKGAKQ